MRIKIISDGTKAGTRVVDERGEKVEMVTAIEWRIGAPGVADARITFRAVPVEVEADVKVKTEGMQTSGRPWS